MNNFTPNDFDLKLSSTELLEHSGYIKIGQEQLYYVIHPTSLPLRARVILAGPFASERPHRYISWVRWARHLASHGFEVMRFDYRGVGESTGRFEDYSFRAWSEDLQYCAEWFQQRTPAVPLVIHGLGMGALLGDAAFKQSTANILLVWLPPKNAREMLYEQLKVKMSNNFSLPTSERKTRDQFIEELENGTIVEVEGHNWTPQLWSEASEFEFDELNFSEKEFNTNRRIRHIGKLDSLAIHTLGGVGPNPLRGSGGASSMRLVNPDLSISFTSTTEWLTDALTAVR